MYQHARDLEFEQAALIRDQIVTIKKQHFGEAASVQATTSCG